MHEFLYVMAESLEKVIKAAPDEENVPSPLRACAVIKFVLHTLPNNKWKFLETPGLLREWKRVRKSLTWWRNLISFTVYEATLVKEMLLLNTH